jgi:hypothetical protein
MIRGNNETSQNVCPTYVTCITRGLEALVQFWLLYVFSLGTKVNTATDMLKNLTEFLLRHWYNSVLLFNFLFLFFHILELISCEIKHYVKLCAKKILSSQLFLLKIFINCTKYRSPLFICPLDASGGFTDVPSLRAFKYSPYEIFVRRTILKMKSYRPKQSWKCEKGTVNLHPEVIIRTLLCSYMEAVSWSCRIRILYRDAVSNQALTALSLRWRRLCEMSGPLAYLSAAVSSVPGDTD